MSTLDVAMLAGLAAAAWFGSSKVCAIMGGCATQTLAEHDAHRVCRAEAAVTDDEAWRVLRQPARRVQALNLSAGGSNCKVSRFFPKASAKSVAEFETFVSVACLRPGSADVADRPAVHERPQRRDQLERIRAQPLARIVLI
jgi:hypothetical protein